MSLELKGWSRPRAVRVAFLVQQGEHESLVLDGIFADSYSRWGGRFSLIVPCRNNRIEDRYWPWLEAYDPDLVYSYVPLSDDDIRTIHERIDPAQYAVHPRSPDKRLDVFGFKPRYPFAPLASLSTIFKLARFSPPRASSSGLRILDCSPTERPSNFLTDNFGTYSGCQNTGVYPHDARAAATLRTIISLDGRSNGMPPDLDPIPDEMTAFSEFASGHITSMSMLSARFVSRLNIRAGSWSESFNLVVGDTFEDRILFWNVRLLIPSWLDADLCCMRVTLDQLRNAEFLAVLANVLRQRNFVNGGSGGQSQLAIRSVSLNKQELDEAFNLILGAGSWAAVSFESVTLDDMIPPKDAIEGALESRSDGEGLFGPAEWSRFSWSPPIAFPDAVAPQHVSDAPIRQKFIQGYWGIDLSFEHSGPGPRLGDDNRFFLPRHWRMAGAFAVTLKGDARQAALPFSRSTRQHNYSVFAGADYPLESIAVPTPIEAMRHALTQIGMRREPGRVTPLQRATWMRPSNEARYLRGVLGLVGGLRRASQFLLHPFLRDVFMQMGGATNFSDNELQPTVARLQKRAANRPQFDLNDLNDQRSLAILIAAAAISLKRPSEVIRYVALKEQWEAYRRKFWESQSQVTESNAEIDWEEHERLSLDVCLAELRRQKVLFQGHQWNCSQCHHDNWINFGELSSEFACEICRHRTNAPIEIPWLFRVNEFLLRALRERGVLPVIWALSTLCNRASQSFVYVESMTFGFGNEERTSDAEADLLIVLDGRSMLCEVKASWRSLRRVDIEKLVSLAIQLRPQIVVLAIMEEGESFKSEIANAKSQLNAVGIEFILITPDASEVDHSPYLHFDGAETG